MLASQRVLSLQSLRQLKGARSRVPGGRL